MIDNKKLHELYEHYKELWHNPADMEQMYVDIMNVLGDDKDKILEFAKKTDKQSQRIISSVIEELRDKFNDMDFINDIVDAVKNRNNYK